MNKYTLLTALLFLSGLIACSASEEKDSIADTTTAEVITDISSDFVNNSPLYDYAPKHQSLEGSFLYIEYFVTDILLPSKTEQSVFIGFYLTDISTEEDGTLTIKRHLCDIHSIPGGTLHLILPLKFIETSPDQENFATVSDDKIEAGPWVGVDGAHLDDPLNDPVPTDVDDPRLFDQDNDGNIGITVKVAKPAQGELYMVRRTITNLEGIINGNNFVQFDVEWHTDEVILDATNPIFKNFQTDTTENNEQSWVELRRLKGSVTCADIVSYFEGLDYAINEYDEEAAQ